MKVVMHCGQAKTGTTTLQTSLHAARHVLQKSGVYYPVGSARTPHTHKALAPLFMDSDRLSAHLLYDGLVRRSDDELATDARRTWDRIRREIDQTKPEVMVLSAETFCSMRTVEEAGRLRDLLSQVSDDVTLNVYVRNPADRYLSAVRQHAKSRGYFLPPKPMNVRPFLESVEQVFDRPVAIRVYDRARLVDNDIVADFVQSQLDGRVPASAVGVIERNDSLSTEAAALMLRFREHAAPDTKGLSLNRASLLKRLVHQVDRKYPRATPDALLPHVKADVIRAATDLDWMRERYGVEVPGIEYPVADGQPLPDMVSYVGIEDVCQLDLARLELITALTMDSLVAALEQRRSRSVVGVARRVGSHLPPATRDRVKRRFRWEPDQA